MKTIRLIGLLIALMLAWFFDYRGFTHGFITALLIWHVVNSCPKSWKRRAKNEDN